MRQFRYIWALQKGDNESLEVPRELTERIHHDSSSADIQELITSHLEKRKFEVTALARGKEVIPHVERGFDLLLLDLNLPDVDGMDLIDQTQQAVVDGKVVDLTNREFALLVALASKPGRIFSRMELLEMVWGEDCDADHRRVDLYVSRLRSKLEGSDSRQLVVSVYGSGYRLVV